MKTTIKKELQTVTNELEVLISKIEILLQDVEQLEKTKKKVKAKPVSQTKKPAVSKVKKQTAVKATKQVNSKPEKEGLTSTEKVIKIIKMQKKKGVNVSTLRQKTGYDEKKISNIVHRASKKGRIKSIARGVYIAT